MLNMTSFGSREVKRWVAPRPLQFIYEALTLSVTVLGDGAFREVIMVKCSYKSGALTQ